MTQIFDPKFQKKLIAMEKKKPEWQTVQALNDIADISQELLNVVDQDGKTTGKQIDEIGVLLTDAREQLVLLNNKEINIPDVSKPITDAISKLEKAFNKINVQPIVNVPQLNTPDVNITTDLSKLEKILKTDIPAAFNKSIQAIPQPKDLLFPTIPDNTDSFAEIIDWLKSIDTGVRMHPIAGTNTAASGGGGGGTQYIDGDATIPHPIGNAIIYDNNGIQSDVSVAKPFPVSAKQTFTEVVTSAVGSLNADILPSTDVSAFKEFSIFFLNSALVGTITVQGSNDNTNWVGVACQATNNTNSNYTSTITPGGIWVGPIAFRYLRVRVTAYTSGAVLAGVCELYTQASKMNTTGVNNNSALIVTSPTNATSVAYEASRVIKASTGNLWGFSGYNSGPAQFLQLHNTTTVPADTSIPVWIGFVQANSNFAVDFGTRGRNFATGITICNSSTGPTKTIGAANCWFDVQYT